MGIETICPDNKTKLSDALDEAIEACNESESHEEGFVVSEKFRELILECLPTG